MARSSHAFTIFMLFSVIVFDLNQAAIRQRRTILLPYLLGLGQNSKPTARTVLKGRLGILSVSLVGYGDKNNVQDPCAPPNEPASQYRPALIDLKIPSLLPRNRHHLATPPPDCPPTDGYPAENSNQGSDFHGYYGGGYPGGYPAQRPTAQPSAPNHVSRPTPPPAHYPSPTPPPVDHHSPPPVQQPTRKPTFAPQTHAPPTSVPNTATRLTSPPQTQLPITPPTIAQIISSSPQSNQVTTTDDVNALIDQVFNEGEAEENGAGKIDLKFGSTSRGRKN